MGKTPEPPEIQRAPTRRNLWQSVMAFCSAFCRDNPSTNKNDHLNVKNDAALGKGAGPAR